MIPYCLHYLKNSNSHRTKHSTNIEIILQQMMIWLQDMVRMWWTVAAIRMLLCHLIPMSTPRPVSRITIKKLVLNFQTYPAQVVSKIYIMLRIANGITAKTSMRLYYFFYY